MLLLAGATAVRGGRRLAEFNWTFLARNKKNCEIDRLFEIQTYRGVL
jgi:hypothetical protein